MWFPKTSIALSLLASLFVTANPVFSKSRQYLPIKNPDLHPDATFTVEGFSQPVDCGIGLKFSSIFLNNATKKACKGHLEWRRVRNTKPTCSIETCLAYLNSADPYEGGAFGDVRSLKIQFRGYEQLDFPLNPILAQKKYHSRLIVEWNDDGRLCKALGIERFDTVSRRYYVCYTVPTTTL